MGYFDHHLNLNRFNIVAVLVVIGSVLLSSIKRQNEVKKFPKNMIHKQEELEKLKIMIIIGGVFLALGIAAIIYFMFTPI